MRIKNEMKKADRKGDDPRNPQLKYDLILVRTLRLCQVVALTTWLICNRVRYGYVSDHFEHLLYP